MSSPDATRGKSTTKAKSPAQAAGARKPVAANAAHKPTVPKAKAPVTRAKPAKQATPKPAKQVATAASQDAERLAALIDTALEKGQLDTLSPKALQALFAALCKTFSARIEAGEELLPLSPRGRVTPTDVMVTASKLLKSANLQVFELGMWQSWTGR
jgi:hypothetical protein